MKKIYTVLIILGLFNSSQSIAQSYYSLKGEGIDIDLNDILQNGSVVLNRTNNDVLSAAQAIPFDFNFYGSNVRDYRVSENGYITFDVSSSISANVPIALPDTNAPKGSIFAFWNDWELKAAPNANFPTNVVIYNTGTAPNRKHIIQWFGISQRGRSIANNADVAAFGMVLHEGSEGLIEMYYAGGFGSTSFSGLVGVQDINGADGTSVSGINTSYPFSDNTDVSQITVYKIIQGTQSTSDVALEEITTDGKIVKGQSYKVTGKVRNNGASPITSFDINYSINGETPVKETISGIIVSPNGGTYNFSSNQNIMRNTGGEFGNLVVTIDNLSTGSDENMNDNSLSKPYFVFNNNSGAKKVFFEEATGTWCVHCPDAHGYMEQLKTKYKEDLVIAIHHLGDAMENSNSNAINNAFAAGYPNGYIDRILFDGSPKVGVGRTSWDQLVASQINDYTPANIFIENVSFENDIIKFDVTAEFTDFYQGELRIGAMIKESYMRGIGTGWDQTIASVYTSTAGHQYFGYTSPMVGYIHQDVVISVPSGPWGRENSTSSSVISPGDKFTETFTYRLPAMNTVNIPENSRFEPTGEIIGRNKPADLWLIGFIAEYNNDITQRNVLNANERQMWNIAGSVKDQTNSIQEFNAFPNPSSNQFDFVFNTKEQLNNATLTIVDMQGKIVYSESYENLLQGYHKININTENFANGIYSLRLNSETGNQSLKVVIEK